MKPYRITIFLVAILMSGCDVVTPNQGLVIERARAIRNYPVSRSKFVSALELSKVDSDRADIAGATSLL
jgi:hypothetical protein